MSSPTDLTAWNPGAYLNFNSERTRPFVDLLAQVQRPQARSIIDLGCGPGNGMPIVRALWPEAEILGIDASKDMLDRARSATAADPAISYQQADLRHLEGTSRADLVVSNAALQWIPEHLDLLPQIKGLINDGGALAVQVPGNFAAPSHRLLDEIAHQNPYRDYLDETQLLKPTANLQQYLEAISGEGWEVDGWETTYHHILQGPDAVFDWLASAGARPVLSAFPPQLRAEFEAEYQAALREAYPETPLGTVFGMRRMFFIARHTG